MGGMVEAIERGYPQQEIAESSYRFQQAVERKEKVIVGVNDFVQQDEPPIEILYIDETASDTQLAKLETLKRTRNADAVARYRSTRCDRAAHGTTNLMPADHRRGPRLRHGRRRCATRFREVWGEYEESARHLVRTQPRNTRS